MGGNKATVSPDQFASASTPDASAPRSAPRGRAEPSPRPFTTAGPFTSPGESAALTPAQGLRAPSGLLAPARPATPAFSSPGEAASPRRRSLLDPFQDDTQAPPRRNDVLPGGFGGARHVMSGEDSAANGRLAKTLTGTGDFATFAPILRGALRDNPARATVELADLSRQTHALDPGSGAKLDRILDSEAKALGIPSPLAQKPAPRQVASLAPTTLNDVGGPAARTPERPASKTAQTRKPPPQILAAAAKSGPSQTFPRPKQKPAPLPEIHPDFLNEISKRESQGRGDYAAKTGELPPPGTMSSGLALGKYQFQRGALIDAGYVDRDTKNWKGKDGVGSAEDFLKNPKAQEKALRELSKVYWEKQLKTNGARAREGQTIDGVKDRFTVTKSGLLAASHREGPRRVKEYLNRLESLGWKSDKSKFGNKDQIRKFLAIETRLREFSTVPFDK